MKAKKQITQVTIDKFGYILLPMAVSFLLGMASGNSDTIKDCQKLHSYNYCMSQFN